MAKAGAHIYEWSVNVHNPEKMKQHKKVCAANYEGSSGGIEVAGATTLCARSEHKLDLRDVDSKGFTAILKKNHPYGNNVNITKLECVGHTQKRVGTRLRPLKWDMKGQKLSDGKGFGGKGRHTDTEIDQ
ncbi:hypothetical protein PR048_017112 [Dryococelus australis]|uniref:Mutator-like transposase domain-containing protein n=1 Tax=Dryococelus australis TaxID=614101 RepID=A0ABQ9H8N3_9NEOP|nr:hypothetical protein PR048_017112 [Dryococelus australis]